MLVPQTFMSTIMRLFMYPVQIFLYSDHISWLQSSGPKTQRASHSRNETKKPSWPPSEQDKDKTPAEVETVEGE